MQKSLLTIVTFVMTKYLKKFNYFLYIIGLTLILIKPNVYKA